MVNLSKIRQCMSDSFFCKALIPRSSERSSLPLRPLSMLPPKILRLCSPHSTASPGQCGRAGSFFPKVHGLWLASYLLWPRLLSYVSDSYFQPLTEHIKDPKHPKLSWSYPDQGLSLWLSKHIIYLDNGGTITLLPKPEFMLESNSLPLLPIQLITKPCLSSQTCPSHWASSLFHFHLIQVFIITQTPPATSAALLHWSCTIRKLASPKSTSGVVIPLYDNFHWLPTA